MEENTATYYTQTENRGDLRQKLIGSVETDVCIIGGGLAGVNTLLELSEKKVSAILLEEKTIGNDASGRNGGFLSAGYSVSINILEQRFGRKYAQELYKLSIEGVDIVRRRSQKLSAASTRRMGASSEKRSSAASRARMLPFTTTCRCTCDGRLTTSTRPR